MRCPNINSPEWKALVDKIGENNAWREFLANGYIPSADNYDVIESISKETTQQIKPGVQELFESNQDLANAVYEALGYELPTKKLQGKKIADDELVLFDVVEELTSGERNNLPSSILINKLLKEEFIPEIKKTDIALGVSRSGVWKIDTKTLSAGGNNKSELAKTLAHELLHSVTENVIYNYQNLKGDIDLNDKYYESYIKDGHIKILDLTKSQIEALDNLVRIRNKVVDHIKQNKENLQKQDRGFGTYDYFIKTNYSETETDLHEFISEVFTNPELISILKEIPTEGKKSNLFKDFVEAIAKILGFTNTSILEDVIAYSEEAFFAQPQITPQQKQQALQLYSQYLDQIFPDSKVKDIVYHGTDAKFDKFDKSKLKENTETALSKIGFNFVNSRRIASKYGKLKSVILNIINLKEINIRDIEVPLEVRSHYESYYASKLKNISEDGVILEFRSKKSL